jgi:hypothetical protein
MELISKSDAPNPTAHQGSRDASLNAVSGTMMPRALNETSNSILKAGKSQEADEVSKDKMRKIIKQRLHGVAASFYVPELSQGGANGSP